MFANMKIGVRLAIGFAATLLLMVIVAVIGVTRISALNSNVDDLVKDKFPKTVQANDMLDSLNVVARRLRNAYIFPAADAAKELDAIPDQSKIITDRLGKLEKSVTSDAGKAAFKKVTDARGPYVRQMERYLELLKSNKKDEASLHLQTDLRKAQTDYMGAISALADLQTQLVEKAGKDAAELATSSERMLVILAIVAALVSLCLLYTSRCV